MTKQYKKDYFEDRKLKYEKNHGVFIHEFMFTEFSNRILGQCNCALNDLQKQLDLEIARAKAEEERIENKAHNELEKVFNIINVSNESFNSTPNTPIPYKYLDLNNNTNDLTVNDTDRGSETLQETLTKSYTAISNALHTINNLYMSNNAESYKVDEDDRLVKNENKGKLISNYNSTLTLIVSYINYLNSTLKQLTERVAALENK